MANLNYVKLAGIASLIFGAISTIASDWAQKKETEKIVEEKVNEALAKKTREGL